jgi:hypothetical protein
MTHIDSAEGNAHAENSSQVVHNETFGTPDRYPHTNHSQLNDISESDDQIVSITPTILQPASPTGKLLLGIKETDL